VGQSSVDVASEQRQRKENSGDKKEEPMTPGLSADFVPGFWLDLRLTCGS